MQTDYQKIATITRATNKGIKGKVAMITKLKKFSKANGEVSAYFNFVLEDETAAILIIAYDEATKLYNMIEIEKTYAIEGYSVDTNSAHTQIPHKYKLKLNETTTVKPIDETIKTKSMKLSDCLLFRLLNVTNTNQPTAIAGIAVSISAVTTVGSDALKKTVVQLRDKE